VTEPETDTPSTGAAETSVTVDGIEVVTVQAGPPSGGPIVAGVDIGGTKLAVGAADASGRLLAHCRLPSLVQRGPDAVVKDIARMVRAAVSVAADRISSGPTELGFLGVASPGPLSQKRGVILSTPNMPGWEDYPLIRRLRDDFGCPTVLENDANAACLGEALFGAGRGRRFVAYFTVSTGIGGGFVQDGRVMHGADGNAAEFGHTIVAPEDGAMCGCGRAGHLEAYANGASIVRRARERLASGRASTLVDVAGSIDDITPEVIAAAAEDGDALCREIWDETGAFLGIGITNVVHSFNPDVVVLGGGISNVGDLLFAPVRRAVQARVMPDYRDTFTIERALLGDHVGIMGAIGLALEHGVMRRDEKS
jgi:glucokinase